MAPRSNTLAWRIHWSLAGYSTWGRKVRNDLLAEQQQIGMLVFLFIFLLPHISSLW